MLPVTQNSNLTNTTLTLGNPNIGAGGGAGTISEPSYGTGTLAQGDSGLGQAGQGLLNATINRAYGNDTNQLSQGVASAGNGLIRTTPSGDSLGMVTPSDLTSYLGRQATSATANNAAQIQRYLSATQPIRQAQYEQDAEGDLAKVQQLDYNDYMLYNQQQLQQLQLQQAQAAAQQGWLGNLLSLGGMALGAGAATVLTGGAAAPVLAGIAAGGSLGKAAGGVAGIAK